MNGTLDRPMEQTSSYCPLSYLDVAGYRRTMVIRICGLANMHLALTAQQFMTNACDRGYNDFMLDLSECRGLDSTFMGTLVSLFSELETMEAAMHLYNVGEVCMKSLNMLGVSGFLHFGGEQTFPELECARLTPIEDNPTARLKLIKHAHEQLCEIDSSNQDRFGAFLKMIHEEMGDD